MTDGTIHILSSITGVILQHRPLEQRGVTRTSAPSLLALDGDNLILTQRDPPTPIVYNISSEVVAATLEDPDGKDILILKALQDEDEFILAGFYLDGSVCIWDIHAQKCIHTMKLHDDIAHYCSVDGPNMVTSSPDGTLTMSNWRTGKIIWKKTIGNAEIWTNSPEVGNAVFTLAVSEDKVVAGTQYGNLWVFELLSGAQLAKWKGC